MVADDVREQPAFARVASPDRPLCAGEQSEAAIHAARMWLLRRRNQSTACVFRELAKRIYPRLPIDKTPLVTDLCFLRPALKAFPHAKFLHLARHPVSQGQSYLEFLRSALASYGLRGPLALETVIAQPGSLYGDLAGYAGGTMIADPQMRWHRSNVTILNFLDRVPHQNRLLLRGEDLLRDPDAVLYELASWLGVRRDREAIEHMKHPENSPFACFGPANARFGNDPKFLQAPSCARSPFRCPACTNRRPGGPTAARSGRRCAGWPSRWVTTDGLHRCCVARLRRGVSLPAYGQQPECSAARSVRSVRGPSPAPAVLPLWRDPGAAFCGRNAANRRHRAASTAQSHPQA